MKYIFANLGSDHPGLIEALAQARAEGRAAELPQLIVCPHEMVALSAAHGYAAVSHPPQAVIVHEHIHWIQDVHDQRGIMRGYVKYDNEIRTGKNIKQLVHRALQIAASEPAGPVYLIGPREVMEEQLEPHVVDPAAYRPVEPAALTQQVADEIAAALAAAKHPLIITGNLGRDPEAVPRLVELADLLAIPVLESTALRVNFPADHPMHRGWQFTTNAQNPLLADADVILILDCDVPYIATNNRPSRDAAIYVVDVDPLKISMTLWHVPARRSATANAKVALEQITASVREVLAPAIPKPRPP